MGNGHPEVQGRFGHAAETRQAASLPTAELLALPLAAQRRLVRARLETNAAEARISFRLIEETLALAGGAAGKKLQLPGGWRVLRERQEIVLTAVSGSRRARHEYVLAVPGTVELPELGSCIEARLVDATTIPESTRAQLPTQRTCRKK